MSFPWNALHRSLLGSTVWAEIYPTRLVWVTMLAWQDSEHRVLLSVPGLARMANVTQEECEAALRCFLSPDPDSRTKDHFGRRIEEIDGGWLILNGEKYEPGAGSQVSERDREAARREKNRIYMRRYRARRKERQDGIDAAQQHLIHAGRKGKVGL